MSKRATKKADPLDGPVDFDRFGPLRRGAFAGAGAPGGPTLRALWEMPQLAPNAVLLRRGRPPAGERRSSVVRSIRLPEEVWRAIDAHAKRRRLGVHQAMRAALLGWLGEPAAPAAAQRPRRGGKTRTGR